ncbi:marvel domain-containing protein [Triangularia verruculosa]|uniref:Marvel domain-containing protein n=1 Tax=Triangularia verruculosa TaxID=2587418 RepID=A0AAN6XLG3_9PEZI|nr:marvel domain-containing protein [Triangularia verruculosa]
MDLPKALTAVLRFLQLLLSITILALTLTFLKAQVYGDVPVTTKFTVFVAAFTIVIAVLNLAGTIWWTWLEDLLPTIVLLGLDGVAALLLIAAGIAWTVGLKDAQSCSNYEKMYLTALINGGTVDVGGEIPFIGVANEDDTHEALFNRLQGLCKKATANQSLMFVVGAAFCGGLIALRLWRHKRGGQKVTYV